MEHWARWVAMGPEDREKMFAEWLMRGFHSASLALLRGFLQYDGTITGQRVRVATSLRQGVAKSSETAKKCAKDVGVRPIFLAREVESPGSISPTGTRAGATRSISPTGTRRSESGD